MTTAATDPHDSLRPAQREHLARLLTHITDPQLASAVEAIFYRGLHDINDLRFVFQHDMLAFHEKQLSEMQGIRGVLGHLDSGLTIAEHLTETITQQEVLPEIRALRGDVAHLTEVVAGQEVLPAVRALHADLAKLVAVVGTPPEEDRRPLIARQTSTERAVTNLQHQMSWLAPAVAIATLLGAVALLITFVGPAAILAVAHVVP